MSNFEYLAPPNLAGVYAPCANAVDLTWDQPALNNVTVFNVPGSYTWSPTQGFNNFAVSAISGGAGGSGGALATTGEGQQGGFGGAAGGISKASYQLSDLPALIAILVGGGGFGGPSQTSPPISIGHQPNLPGGNGGSSSFGANTPLVATGAIAYQPSGFPSPAGGVGTTESGNLGGLGCGENQVAQPGIAGTLAPGSGGGGGGFYNTATPVDGGVGGAAGSTAGGTAGAASTIGLGGAGGAGAAGANYGPGGGGGGGGGVAPYGTNPEHGGDGGDGGAYGAGGGGGAVGGNGGVIGIAGKGGAGAGGVVYITASNPQLPLTGYAISRDGVQIATVGLVTAFTDTAPTSGTNVYTVQALSGSVAISDVSATFTFTLGLILSTQAVGNAGSDMLLTWTAENCNDTTFAIYENGSTEPLVTIPAINQGNNVYNSVNSDFNYGYAVQQLTPNTEYCFYVVGDANGTSNGVTNATGCRGVEIFNCDCTLEPLQMTLEQLRTRMMIRLGYPNQAANPPPGMSMLVDAFLYDSQKLIWKQLSRAGLNVERFFRWVMVPGQRYYGISANADKCDFKLDPYKIVWAGFEDLNRAWYRLTEGVPPEFYTRANINFGWPTHYEIRSCIEIFPAPQAPYTLWIKGDMGLAPFTEDSDTATIDDQAVFLLALGMAKSHYGQQDASAVLAQADTYIRGLVAGIHGTRRYVPKSSIQNPATPPRFLPLGNSQA